MTDIDELEQLQAKRYKMKKSFEGWEKMLTYYTGLESIEVFMLVLDQIKPWLTSKNQRLTEFYKLLLCLIKLRLNVPLTDLGFRV